MISSVTREINGEPVVFKFSARAMIAVERRAGMGLVEYVRFMESEPSIEGLADLMSDCADDGKGREGFGLEVIDALGFDGAGELFGDIFEAAFPNAAKAGQVANAKKAAGAAPAE